MSLHALKAYELARTAHELAQTALGAAYNTEASAAKLRDVTRRAATLSIACPELGCGALEFEDCHHPAGAAQWMGPHALRVDVSGVNGPERRQEGIDRVVWPVTE
jgi:hypothetical protein